MELSLRIDFLAFLGFLCKGVVSVSMKKSIKKQNQFLGIGGNRPQRGFIWSGYRGL